MAVRSSERLLDGEPRDLFPGQFAAVVATPGGKQFACTRQVILLEGEMDVGKIMAELPESHREIEREHVECKRKQRTPAHEQRVHEPGKKHLREHGNQPCNDAVLGLARVELALQETGITRHLRVKGALI